MYGSKNVTQGSKLGLAGAEPGRQRERAAVICLLLHDGLDAGKEDQALHKVIGEHREEVAAHAVIGAVDVSRHAHEAGGSPGACAAEGLEGENKPRKDHGREQLGDKLVHVLHSALGPVELAVDALVLHENIGLAVVAGDLVHVLVGEGSLAGNAGVAEHDSSHNVGYTHGDDGNIEPSEAVGSESSDLAVNLRGHAAIRVNTIGKGLSADPPKEIKGQHVHKTEDLP